MRGVFMVIQRNQYLKKLIDRQWNDQIKVITGQFALQCGRFAGVFVPRGCGLTQLKIRQSIAKGSGRIPQEP